MYAPKNGSTPRGNKIGISVHEASAPCHRKALLQPSATPPPSLYTKLCMPTHTVIISCLKTRALHFFDNFPPPKTSCCYSPQVLCAFIFVLFCFIFLSFFLVFFFSYSFFFFLCAFFPPLVTLPTAPYPSSPSLSWPFQLVLPCPLPGRPALPHFFCIFFVPGSCPPHFPPRYVVGTKIIQKVQHQTVAETITKIPM